jgi:predicted nucleic acid-binding protein
MRILLDTNIIIHREASRVINHDIGQLFNWLDKLGYTKCVHPLTVHELEKYQDKLTVETMKVKLASYTILKTEAPIYSSIQKIIDTQDKTTNDVIDSKLLNELVNDRVEYLITEDKNIYRKAKKLGISDFVFTIDRFLEQAINENPDLIDYNVLSVKKEYFGNIDVNINFFDSFREDYKGFEKWFNKKSDEIAYICYYSNEITAFLYIKIENIDENYSNISPSFQPKKRLKIGTLKVSLNGLRIGERFLKIVFDNALRQKVDEIYVTIFDKRPEQKALINLLSKFGFYHHGIKQTPTGNELVFVRDFSRLANKDNPKSTFPFVPKDTNVYFVSIYPKYHTELFPDSKLNTESSTDFIENLPHRNAIRKVYISHAIERPLKRGDVLLFYRTGGYYKGVVTTVGIVDSIIDNIKSEDELIDICQKRTVLNKQELKEFWNYHSKLKPFVINLLYSYSLPRRPNLKRLIELGIIEAVDKIPRGFGKISWEQFETILKDTGSNESTISN